MDMTTTDYLLDITLIALVFRQIKESRLGWFAILLPLAICTWAGFHYLHAIPTAGNDLALILGFAGVGIVLGGASAMATRVRRDAEGHTLVKAGWIAAGAWVLGMGFRFGFALWTSHGGAGSLMTFSEHHDITTSDAWSDALVLMAFGEVFVRTAVLVIRGRLAAGTRSEHRSLVAA
jgi:hypothetical protein